MVGKCPHACNNLKNVYPWKAAKSREQQQHTCLLWLPFFPPRPNTQLQGHERFSEMGQGMRTGSKVTQWKGAQLIWGGEWYDGEMTICIMCKKEGLGHCWSDVVVMAVAGMCAATAMCMLSRDSKEPKPSKHRWWTLKWLAYAEDPRKDSEKV